MFTFIFFRFLLYYYSNSFIKASNETKLVIDTRGANKQQPVIEVIEDVENDEDDEKENVDPMEKAIQTKYIHITIEI